jgi:hypothetical protein
MAGSRVAIWSGLRCNACSPISGPADRHRRHLQGRPADAVARQFARLVEIFDAHDAAFVPVTQQLNTTSEMGHLTLNRPHPLISFESFSTQGGADGPLRLSTAVGWNGRLPTRPGQHARQLQTGGAPDGVRRPQALCPDTAAGGIQDLAARGVLRREGVDRPDRARAGGLAARYRQGANRQRARRARKRKLRPRSPLRCRPSVARSSSPTMGLGCHLGRLRASSTTPCWYRAENGKVLVRLRSSDSGWVKWRACDPIFSHRNNAARLARYAAAHVARDQDLGRLPRTMREFIGEFRGLRAAASRTWSSKKAACRGSRRRAVQPGE